MVLMSMLMLKPLVTLAVMVLVVVLCTRNPHVAYPKFSAG